MDNFEKLIDQIIEDAGLGGLPAEYRDEYRAKIMAEAQKALGIRAMRELTPEEIEEFNDLVVNNSGDSEKIRKYLDDHIDNFEVLMEEALDEFRQKMIEATAKISSNQ